MAVEAGHHHTLFHPQMMLTNSSIDNPNQNQSNGVINTTPLGYGIGNPLAAMYCSGLTDSVFPANNNNNNNNAPLKAESGLTCSLPVSRKRARDCSDLNSLMSFVNSQNMNQNQNQTQIQRCVNGTGLTGTGSTGIYTFLGEDISLQIQQQQLEIDQFIAHQTEKARREIENQRKRNSRRLILAVEEKISNRLRAKEEEILKITKLNFALEEKVKSLSVENQIWRELAQTNEATANTLRNNLKQVLEQVVLHDEYRHRSTTACVDELAEDAQSCCESNNEEKRRRRVNDDLDNNNNNNNNIYDDCTSVDNNNNNNRLCKKCGNEESRVLLLPCRHLCLCTGCASSVNICPVCKSVKNISVHVNMS